MKVKTRVRALYDRATGKEGFEIPIIEKIDYGGVRFWIAVGEVESEEDEFKVSASWRELYLTYEQWQKMQAEDKQAILISFAESSMAQALTENYFTKPLNELEKLNYFEQLLAYEEYKLRLEELETKLKI